MLLRFGKDILQHSTIKSDRNNGGFDCYCGQGRRTASSGAVIYIHLNEYFDQI